MFIIDKYLQINRLISLNHIYLINILIHQNRFKLVCVIQKSFLSASVEEWSEWVLYADKIHPFVPTCAEILLL